MYRCLHVSIYRCAIPPHDFSGKSDPPPPTPPPLYIPYTKYNCLYHHELFLYCYDNSITSCALYIYATRLAHSYSGSPSMNIATRRCYLFTTQQISQHRGFTGDRHGSRPRSLKRNVAGSSVLPGILLLHKQTINYHVGPSLRNER